MINKKNVIRFQAVAIVLSVALAGLIGRLVYLHLFNLERNANLAQKGRITKTLVTRRGVILDGSPSGNILAMNMGVRDIAADPSLIATNKRFRTVVAELARRLNCDAAELARRLNQPTNCYYEVARNVPEELAREVLHLRLPGIYSRETTLRKYPLDAFMCHVIGFVNRDGVGAAGIEQTMDRFLKGSQGLIESTLDARRNELYIYRRVSVLPQEGADVSLTVDQNLQYMVETALDRAMEKHRARGAWAIIQQVRTGAILALASRPAFNPNEYGRARDEQKLNRAIGYLFEPGSTFKPAVVAAALNERIVTPDTVFNCENGQWLYRGRMLRDYHPYRELTVTDIIQKSSNIGAAKIALLLGDEGFERYLRQFGIGRRLGIELPSEQAGILMPAARWSGISATRIAMGQGVAVTALQMLGVLSAIANDGFLMKPYVVKRVTAKDGSVLYEAAPEVLSRPISGLTARLMRQILTGVSEEGGTGVKAAVEGFQVAGKTGSAQKPVNGHYSDTDYWATFCGFLPAENPEIAMIVTLDEPQPFHTGGIVAAPVFGEIAEQAVRYLDIQPTASYAAAER
jgi:cell division protein FtsI/penicillin-binding protein 2